MSINRILKPDGRFISTTVSQQHILELKDLISEFGLYSEQMWDLFTEFRNETGGEVLKPFFSDIFVLIYHKKRKRLNSKKTKTNIIL